MPISNQELIEKHENNQCGHKWCIHDHYYEYVNHNSKTCSCCLADKEIRTGKYIRGACKICLRYK